MPERARRNMNVMNGEQWEVMVICRLIDFQVRLQPFGPLE